MVALGDEQAAQVIHHEKVGGDQATTSPGGDILIETILQELQAFQDQVTDERRTNDVVL